MTYVRGRKESVVSAGVREEAVLDVMCEEEVREEEERERVFGAPSKPTAEEVVEVEDSGRCSLEVFVVGVGGSGRASRDSSFMSMFQMRTVWSAEQVARSLMSGERRRRVRYVLCALKTRQGWRVVESWFWYIRQM